MVALLRLQGVPAEMALVATAVIRATTLWFAVLIGMGVLLPALLMAFSTASRLAGSWGVITS